MASHEENARKTRAAASTRSVFNRSAGEAGARSRVRNWRRKFSDIGSNLSDSAGENNNRARGDGQRQESAVLPGHASTGRRSRAAVTRLTATRAAAVLA